jgi:uncharacterized membrane protein
MSNLVAIAYPDVETAETVAEELQQLTTEGSIELDDMVVVERDGEGKIKLHQSRNTTGKGAAGGAGWGMMIGVVLPRISQFGGDVIQTGLGPEREAELQEALAGQAAAV